MTHGRPFKIYRIICTISGKALISGSDHPHNHREPPVWHNRGLWGYRAGVFWRTESAVKNHLHQLCHDWERGFGPDWPSDIYDSWLEHISEKPDWTRLDHLLIEETIVSQYNVSEINAKEFMGVMVDAY